MKRIERQARAFLRAVGAGEPYETNVGRQVREGDAAIGVEGHDALHHIPQLTNVARPGIGFQRLPDIRADHGGISIGGNMRNPHDGKPRYSGIFFLDMTSNRGRISSS